MLGRERAIGILVRGSSGRLACGRAATRLADAHPQAPSPRSMLRPEPRASPRVREARMWRTWSSAPDSPEPPPEGGTAFCLAIGFYLRPTNLRPGGNHVLHSVCLMTPQHIPVWPQGRRRPLGRSPEIPAL